MSTIKTRLISDERFIITKLINNERKVSCSCCGFCGFFDIGVLLYDAGFSGTRSAGPASPVFLSFDEITLKMSAVGGGSFRDDSDKPPPVGNRNYRRRRACWRFLCREVVVVDGQIESETNRTIGGGTTTGKNLWDDICLPLLGPEQQSGTYIYSISFNAWWITRTFDTNRGRFQRSDTNYEVIKWEITEQI
jgi:hypothetical protein